MILKNYPTVILKNIRVVEGGTFFTEECQLMNVEEMTGLEATCLQLKIYSKIKIDAKNRDKCLRKGHSPGLLVSNRMLPI